MRSPEDRRHWHIIATFPLEDSNRETVLDDRRSGEERRFNDMTVEERQTLLSEMPGVVVNHKK